MNKYLLKYMVFCFIAMLSVSCNDSESDLLDLRSILKKGSTG